MPKSVKKCFALFWLPLPMLILARPGNATIITDPSSHPGERSSESAAAGRRLKTSAEFFSAADSASTHLALRNSLVHERNPWVNTSAAGLVALAATKILMLELIDLKLSNAEKKAFFPLVSALSASATINNMLLAVSASNPVAIAGGIVAGLYTHQQQTAHVQRGHLKVYCSGGSYLRNCSNDYAPQYVVRLR